MRIALSSLSLVLGLTLGLAACTDQAHPLEVTTHPAEWQDPAFHGRMVLESANKTASCTSCHGTHLDGGSAGVSCSQSGCHVTYPHRQGFASAQSVNFHGTYIAEHAAWDLTRCQSCHGTDYAGEGTASKSCLTCHTGAEGPRACNTCHGDVNAAPPEDLLGRTDTGLMSVGAHQAHLKGDDSPAACLTCHAATTSFDDPDHIDGGAVQAEVVFADWVGRAVYDAATGTCSDVYCHGAFSFEKAARPENLRWAYADATLSGTPQTVRWTAVGEGQAACGSCHALPPEGHRLPDDRVPVENCGVCHADVVDQNYDIINPALHANGRANALGSLNARFSLPY